MKGIKMNKWIIVILLVAVNVCSAQDANEPAQYLTGWVNGRAASSDSIDLGLWVGYRQEQSERFDTEFGIAADFTKWSEETEKDDVFALGGYALAHIKDFVEVPLGFGGIDTLVGEPFVGASYLFDMDGNGTKFAPCTGFRVFDIFSLVYEYQFYTNTEEPDGSKIGLSMKWKF